MKSIFLLIKNIKNPHPVLITPKKPAQDIITRWNKEKTPERTKLLIEYIKPAVLSALHTYVPGQEESFRLKALSIAVDSLKNYDPVKGSSPKTYIFNSLQRLNRIRRLRENLIHIPLNKVYLRQLIDKKRNQLLDNLGRLPSMLLLADSTGISSKKILKLYNDNITFSLTSSLDALSGLSSFKLKDLTDRDYYNYIYNAASPLDKKIMLWTSGYNGKMLSNNDIAAKLRLSPGAVSQRKAKLQQQLSLIRSLL